MKNKPIIGIIGKVQPKYDEDLWHRIDEVDERRYLIVKKWWDCYNIVTNRNNNEI